MPHGCQVVHTNLLKNSLQAKAQSAEHLQDEVFLKIFGQKAEPWVVQPTLLVDKNAHNVVAGMRPRHRKKPLVTNGLDYSRWTRITESRAFLPLMTSSACSREYEEAYSDDESSEHNCKNSGRPLSALSSLPEKSQIVFSPPPSVKVATSVGAKSTTIPSSSVENDEDIAEEKRVEMAIRAVKKQDGSLLREIQEIKERHKTLEALTSTRARAEKNQQQADTSARRPIAISPMSDSNQIDSRTAHVHRASREKTFELFRRKTFVSSDRHFKPEMVILPSAGVAWAIKASPESRDRPPRNVWKQPQSIGARYTGNHEERLQWADVDLGSAYFLPPHVSDAKTPIEAALRLHKVLTEVSMKAKHGDMMEHVV